MRDAALLARKSVASATESLTRCCWVRTSVPPATRLPPVSSDGGAYWRGSTEREACSTELTRTPSPAQLSPARAVHSTISVWAASGVEDSSSHARTAPVLTTQPPPSAGLWLSLNRSRVVRKVGPSNPERAASATKACSLGGSP